MAIPRIRPLLLSVLRMTADSSEHTVEEIRQRASREFKLTRKELEQKHSKTGMNVFVNRVAGALARLVMSRAITRKSKKEGVYRITKRGIAILKGNPSELPIEALLNFP